jgi:adenosylcobinamide kinase / adenosylcobinamide-phosphate guanylyltransferase
VAGISPIAYEVFIPWIEGDRLISDLPRLTLILGGARSGKSRYGERLLVQEPAPWIYVATARALDDEMEQRIAEHRQRRDRGWRTIEAPIDVGGALGQAGEAPVLLDCLTLWLTNLMLDGRDIAAATKSLAEAMAARRAPTILIGNEVGLGLVPETPLGRRFRDEAGRLHQRLAGLADRVILMVAGLPLTVR